ncbi:hypothetical protein N9181_01585 [bacterium]|nr:hypothetical protein [bacterium]
MGSPILNPHGNTFSTRAKAISARDAGEFSHPILQHLIDWGPITQPAEETNDWKTSALAADFLQREHTRPFFLACGIYHPHLPWYVPEKFFDQHPLDSVELPPHLDNDLDDVPPIGKRMAE